jgi:hypothetical protein
LRSESPHVTQWDETARGTLAVLVTSSPLFSRATTPVWQAQEAWYATKRSGEAAVGDGWAGATNPYGAIWPLAVGAEILDCSEFTIRLLVARGDLTSSARTGAVTVPEAAFCRGFPFPAGTLRSRYS